MATSKKLLVKTPVSTDGLSPSHDENKQPIYRETIVEPGSKKLFESLNADLPKVLRHEFETVDVDDETGQVVKAKTTTNAGK